MKKDKGSYKKIALVHILFLLVMLFFAGLYATLDILDNIGTDVKLLHLHNILMGAALSFLCLYLFSKLNKRSSRLLGWQLKRKDWYFIFVIFIVTLIIVSFFILVLKQNQNLKINIELNKFQEPNYYLILLWAIFGWMMASLKEEILSRGFVLYNLKYFNIGMMIFISAVVFMALHVPTNGLNLFRMLSWFAGGIAYAYIYIKSGSLLVTTIIHMMHNYINDWVIGNNSEFAVVELSSKITHDDKLIYELILKLVIIVLTFAFYGRNGFATPAPNLKELWFKNDSNNHDVKININPYV